MAWMIVTRPNADEGLEGRVEVLAQAIERRETAVCRAQAISAGGRLWASVKSEAGARALVAAGEAVWAS